MQFVRVQTDGGDVLLTPQEIDMFRHRLDVQGFSRIILQDGSELFLSDIELENALRRATQHRHSASEASFIAKEQTSVDINTWNKTIVLVGVMVACGVMLLFLRGGGITGMAAAEPVGQGAGLVFGVVLGLLFMALVFGFVKSKFLSTR